MSDYYETLAAMIDSNRRFWHRCPHQNLDHVVYQDYILCDIHPEDKNQRISWMAFDKKNHNIKLSSGKYETLEGLLEELDKIRG